jgi:HD-GYP domain-containing protein (c-di-GMP phosphodiesterase class II)
MDKDDAQKFTASAPGSTDTAEHVCFSTDVPLNRMLRNVVDEVKKYAETQLRHINKLHEIGIALSAEQNLDRLLEKILDEARAFSHADAGTLYVVNHEKECLEFAIVQTDSMNIRMGGTSQPITWPPIPLKLDGIPNHANISSHVALTGGIVNIPDVYQTEEFDFTGTRTFDASTGYHCQSMVVIPMRNKADEIIGVLQLINATDSDNRKTTFSPDDVTLISSLASLAAVAITNVRLYQDLERLFESFIVTIATAIDEKSPYTAGHIRRVQELTMAIASSMHDQCNGSFKNFHLNADEFNELRIAAWLHDIGKIITPEYVVDKATKLEAIYDGIHIVSARFDLLRKEAKIRSLEDKLALVSGGSADPEALQAIDDAFAKTETTLQEEKEFVCRCNSPGEFLGSEQIQKLRDIAAKSGYIDKTETPYLTASELENLIVTKGSLNDHERQIIENHALVTMKMLTCLPFPRKLRHVPVYAAYHHEKLDGTGYPFMVTGKDIPIQARIIAIADVFEALTAKDRPYKKPMTIAKTLDILVSMKKAGHIDGDILDLFIEKRIFEEYASHELDEGQRDY